MRLSFEWLSALVDLSGLAPEEIAHRLTICTAEVESVEESRLDLNGVVAEVVAGPDGQRLHDGREPVSAPWAAGLSAGDRVVMTADGSPARAPGGGDDLWRVGRDVGVGTNPAALVPPHDTLIEIDNKSLTHRPDLWGHYGFARELSAIFGRELASLPQATLETAPGLPGIPVEIRSADCSYYSALAVTFDAAAPSPLYIQRRLTVLAQRSRGLAVDLSNYVMFELAQPTHAFGGGDVEGVRVAPANVAMPFVGVDGIERQLDPEDLLIWFGSAPVGLAGIIGFRDSGVRPDTRQVVLESANFAAARVRRTQRRLGLRTEAGQRFEKSQPWRMAPVAAARLVALMHEADPSARVESAFSVSTDRDSQATVIPVSPTYFSRATGIEIARGRATSVLRSLLFDVEDAGEQLRVTVPPFRGDRDVAEPHDLLEEVVRIIGYDNIEPALPAALVRPAPLADSLDRERRVRRVLAVGHRFSEIQTYGWFDQRWLDQLGFSPEQPLVLVNPTSPELAHMRTALLPNLLAKARLNRERPGIGRLFEIGHVYEASTDHGKSRERTMVAGVSWVRRRTMPESDLLRELRGAVEDMFEILRPAQTVRWDAHDHGRPWEAAGGTVRAHAAGEPLGTVAVTPPKVAEAVGRGLAVVTFEVDLDAIGRLPPAKVEFRSPTVYPGSWFDLTLHWPERRGYAQLAAALTVPNPLCVRREFLYEFRDPDRRDEPSYTFRFWVEAPDRTLSTEDLDVVRTDLLQAAHEAGATVRGDA